jgi:hypothetical protein
MPAPARIDSIFVTVKDIRRGKPLDLPGKFIKRGRREKIVVIQQRDEIARRQGQRAIRVLGDTEVAFQTLEPQTRFGPTLQSFDRFRASRTGINQAQLPMRISLLADRGEHLFEKSNRRVVHRHQQTDFRPMRYLGSTPSLLQQRYFVWLAFVDPPLVSLDWRRLVTDFGRDPFPCLWFIFFFNAAGFQSRLRFFGMR